MEGGVVECYVQDTEKEETVNEDQEMSGRICTISGTTPAVTAVQPTALPMDSAAWQLRHPTSRGWNNSPQRRLPVMQCPTQR